MDPENTRPAGPDVPCDLGDPRLRREARRLYQTLFREPPPPVIEERFAAASLRMNALAAPAEVEAYYRIVAGTGNLEALEVAARWRRRLPLLCNKLRMMVYLAETLPQNQRHFVNERDRRPAALWALAGGGVRTALLLAQGMILLRRHRHA